MIDNIIVRNSGRPVRRIVMRILAGLFCAIFLLDVDAARADPMDYGTFLWIDGEHRGGAGEASVQGTMQHEYVTAFGSASIAMGALMASATVSRPGGSCSDEVNCNAVGAGARIGFWDRLTFRSPSDVPALLAIGYTLQGSRNGSGGAWTTARSRVYIGSEHPSSVVLPDFTELGWDPFNAVEILTTSLDADGQQSATVYIYAELEVGAGVPDVWWDAFSASATASYTGVGNSSNRLPLNLMPTAHPVFHIELPEGFTMTSASGVFMTETEDVPEPATLGLLAAGLGAIGSARRTRRTPA